MTFRESDPQGDERPAELDYSQNEKIQLVQEINSLAEGDCDKLDPWCLPLATIVLESLENAGTTTSEQLQQLFDPNKAEHESNKNENGKSLGNAGTATSKELYQLFDPKKAEHQTNKDGNRNGTIMDEDRTITNNNNDGWKKKIDDAVKKLKDKLSTLIDDLAEKGKEHIEMLSEDSHEPATEYFVNLFEVVNSFVSTMLSYIARMYEWVINKLNTFCESVKSFWKQLVISIKNAAERVKECFTKCKSE